MRLSRIAFLLLILLAPVVAESQAPTKAAKIGWMSGGNPTASDLTMNASRQGMRDLGYVGCARIARRLRGSSKVS